MVAALSTASVRGGSQVIEWSGLPSVPADLTNVVEVAAGFFHGLELRAEGTVAAWGDNNVGHTQVPVGLTNVIAIAAADYHSLALDGELVVVNDQNVVTNPISGTRMFFLLSQ